MIFQKILIFILFLGPLVFFHELGHFLFAKFFGVRVEVFSIGFGPKIVKIKRGFTEYALSLIPLGGYIKMFGDDLLNKETIPANEREQSFVYKSKWARFWIVMGGPLANFILAFVIFMTLLLVGETVPEMRLGVLSPDSLLYQKGFRSGDVVQEINSREAVTITDMIFEEETFVRTVTVKRVHEKISLDVNMDGQKLIQEFSQYPPFLRLPFVINEEGNIYYFTITRKARHGLIAQEGLLIEEIFHVKNIEGLHFSQGESEQSRVSSHELKANSLDGKDILTFLKTHKYYPLDLVVDKIQVGSAADKGNIMPKDIILSLNGTSMNSFSDIKETLQKVQSENVTLTILRNKKQLMVQLTPIIQKQNDISVKLIGIYSAGRFSGPRFVDTPPQGPIAAMIGGMKRTWQTLVKTLDGFKKLIFGDVSLKQIGGPLSIGKVASDSFETSISYFFQLMALISVNLGVINLFPIPILDGGHILFIILEIFNRGPLSRRKMEIAQQIGLSILLMLMVGALFNDFSRFF